MQIPLAAISFLALAPSAESHIYMGYPPTFVTNEVSRDDLISPMNGGPTHPSQWPFPCKGLHLDNSTTRPEVVWTAGDTVKFQLFDYGGTSEHPMVGTGAVHSGGSCQISFSYDRGLTWVAVQSFEGDCPRVRPGLKGSITNSYDLNQDYYFKIPETFPSGDYVIVAWTWINATGNREFYMSCSPVKITGSGPSTNVTPEGHPLLIANLKPLLGGGSQADTLAQCNTEQGTSVGYPEKYEGLNAVIQAPIALNLTPFPGGNDSECGSDNSQVVEALGEPSNRIDVSPAAVRPEQPTPWTTPRFPATNSTSSPPESPLSVAERSSGCTCTGTGPRQDAKPVSTLSIDLPTDHPPGTVFTAPGSASSTTSAEQMTSPDLGGIQSDPDPTAASSPAGSCGELFTTITVEAEVTLSAWTPVSGASSLN